MNKQTRETDSASALEESTPVPGDSGENYKSTPKEKCFDYSNPKNQITSKKKQRFPVDSIKTDTSRLQSNFIFLSTTQLRYKGIKIHSNFFVIERKQNSFEFFE